MQKRHKWTVDPQAEQILNQKNLKWKVEYVKLKDIDFKSSDNNRGRITGKFDEDRITLYGCQMLEGVEFPRPVLAKMPTGKWLLVSGVHRTYGAKEALLEEIEAYTFSTDSQMLMDLLPIKFNIVNGVPVSVDDRFQIAKMMIDEHNITIKDAAAEMGLAQGTLYNFIKADEMRGKLVARGLDPSPLSKDVLQKLCTVKNDKVVHDVATMFCKHKVTASRAATFIGEVAKAASSGELEARKAIVSFEETLEKENNVPVKGIRMSKRAQFWRLLTGLQNYIERNNSLKKLQLADDESLAEARKKFRHLFKTAYDLFGKEVFQESKK